LVSFNYMDDIYTSFWLVVIKKIKTVE